MGRCYRMSKKVSEEEAAEILREMRELENVDKVSLTDEKDHMMVFTKDGDFVNVMNAAVNICRRIAGGCELFFERFAPEL